MIRRIKSGLPIADLILTGWMPSTLKRWFYRLKGFHIHQTARFGFGSVIIGKSVSIGPETKIGLFSIVKGDDIDIGPRVRIGHFTVLDTVKIKIGEGTRIGNQVVVGGLETPRSEFRIGTNCILMEWSFINTTLPVLIGDDVGIGGHSLFFTHGLWPNTFQGYPSKFGPIVVEDKAWLAWRVSVLPGVKIGTGSIISSDACVTKDIPSLALAAGVPAKVLTEDGRFISPVDFERNSRLLVDAITDFTEWMRFNGASIETGENWIIVTRNSKPFYTSRIIIASEPQSWTSSVAVGDTVVSLRGINKEIRKSIEDVGATWLDIEQRERSLLSSALTDEFEEFLRRTGLRFLKYSRRDESFRNRTDGALN